LPRNILTLTEIETLLNAPDTATAAGLRDRAILETFYSTGLRLAELCALTVHDIDLRGGYVRVHRGKGGKDRVVPLGKTAAAYLKEYLEEVRAKWARNQREERALFLGEHWKRPLNKQLVSRLVREYARAAGIVKRVTAHALRHTCATHLVAGGADLVYAQRLLGHRDLTTTQVYVRVAGRDVKETQAATHPAEQAPVPRAFPKPSKRREYRRAK
jgi:integrase/recombinase XerD